MIESDLDMRQTEKPLSVQTRPRQASYYVWFLGEEGCGGVRGNDVVQPVLRILLEREREVEPDKVTLQVSSKGIKLLSQGITGCAAVSPAGTQKFIPSNAITDVRQEAAPDDDVVSVVMLLYNPNTRCPVHLQAFRCDSTVTAVTLRQHLTQLLRPEQQHKVAGLESRLASQGLLSPSSRPFDGASTGSSSSSGAGSGSGPRVTPTAEKMATLYDSLAAELRQKLGSQEGDTASPPFLPPKDYEQSRRKKRHSRAADDYGSATRKVTATGENDSARSSGIGSDDAASSPTQEKHSPPLPPQDQHSCSSEEEWTPFSRSTKIQASQSNQSPTSRPAPRDRSRGCMSPARRPHSPQRIVPVLRKAPVSRKQSARKKEDISKPTVSPQARFQDARDKFLSLERQTSAVEIGSSPHPDIIGRSTSWEVTSPTRNYNRVQRHSSREKRRPFGGSREELLWSKGERDAGYGSRDALMRERRSRDADSWENRGPIRMASPERAYRMPRIRSPEPADHIRAKSLHDLSQRRAVVEDSARNQRDPRRRSLYDRTDENKRGKDLPHAHSSGSPSSSASSLTSLNKAGYKELPDHLRYPGLERATARPVDLFESRSQKRTFDHPVNGGNPLPLRIYPKKSGSPTTHNAQASDHNRQVYYHHAPATGYMRSQVHAAHY